MRWMHIWAGATFAALVVGLIGWLVLSPGWAVGLLQEQARQQLGRELSVKGDAHISLSPLSVTLDNVSLAAPSAQEGSFIAAKSLRIPVSLGQLFTHSADLSRLTLDGAVIAFLIDERGQVNWNFPALGAPAPLSLTIDNGSLRYFDARNGQSLSLTGLDATVEASAEGRLAISGTAELKGRLARIDATLKSLPRVNDDGSPLELSISTPELAATFEGRIATSKVLSLAGPVSLSSPDLRAAARWLGLAIEDGTAYKQFSIAGALDSAGRALAIRRANIAVDQSLLAGDVVMDFRNVIPKLQAVLSTPAFTLDSFLPESGASPGEWGLSPLGFKALKSFDAGITLETPALTYATLKDLPARLVVTLGAGKLDASTAAQIGPTGQFTLTASIDANALPPAFSLGLTAEGVEAAALLKGLFGVEWLSGKGNMTVDVAGSGQTQQEIIGTLKGTASLSLKDGRLVGTDLTAMLAAVSQRILEGWTGQTAGETPYSALAAEATLSDGIASLQGFRFESPTLAVLTTGDVDLLRRAVELRADPKLVTGGSAAALPVSIIVKGPWASPRIYPDVPDILLNPAAGFDKLKSMGLPAGN